MQQQSTGISGDWELSEGEKEEAESLNLDEENYRIYRRQKDADLHAEWMEELEW